MAAVLERPERGLAWIRAQSTPVSLAILGAGIASLVLLIPGTIVVLALNDFTPVEKLVVGFESGTTQLVALMATILGGATAIAGWRAYKLMPTKVSREQTFAGAILGLQSLVLGSVLLVFLSGDVSKFVLNYFDFEVLGPQMGNFVNGAKNTLFLAFSSEFFGILLGLFLSILAVSKRGVVRAPARAYVNFFRGTPLVWQLIFIGIGIPIGLGINIDTYQAGIIALSLNAGAYTAEIFRAGIQSIERGQMEAARGLGMSYLQAMRYAIVPQAIRRVIPPLMNEFVILIKDTSLIIVLGLTADQRDLMNVGYAAVSNTFNATYLVMTGLGYLAITLPLIRIVNSLEKRLHSGLVGITA
jgi:His/Glu/Gln/Arg/opine family amino acid ABC transporter permease subunit